MSLLLLFMKCINPEYKPAQNCSKTIKHQTNISPVFFIAAYAPIIPSAKVGDNLSSNSIPFYSWSKTCCTSR